MFTLGIARKEGEIDLQTDTDASHHPDSILLYTTKYMIVIPGGYLVLVKQPACKREHS